MSKRKIWVTIIGTGIVASLGAAITFFPQYQIILVAASGLVSAVIGIVNGMDNAA
jgi:membrane associated rhomboid family serine protease